MEHRAIARHIGRRDFIAGLAAAPVLMGAAPSPSVTRDQRVGGALVLGGGGARGAYEAGVIEALRRAAGVSDGQRIPGIDVVCGTSIGALNGWFVATAQYSKLADLWHGVGAQHVFEVKRRFSSAIQHRAFILTQIIQALTLAKGLVTNVEGILDGEVVQRWIAQHVDPQTPLVVPLCFTVTNLDKERAELLFRLPFIPTQDLRTMVIDHLRSSVGSNVAVRVVPDDSLHTALRASTSIPVLFDPVVMTSPEGETCQYIDGGVSDNDPIDAGRALASTVNTILVSPASTARNLCRNALDIAVGAFGVAQSRIFAASLRAAFLETQGKRLFATSATTEDQKRFLESVFDVDLFVMRPLAELPVQTVEFDRQEKIDAAYQQGLNDATHGWERYTPVSG